VTLKDFLALKKKESPDELASAHPPLISPVIKLSIRHQRKKEIKKGFQQQDL